MLWAAVVNARGDARRLTTLLEPRTSEMQDIEDNKTKRIEKRNENVKKRIDQRRDKKMGIKKKKADRGSKPKPQARK